MEKDKRKDYSDKVLLFVDDDEDYRSSVVARLRMKLHCQVREASDPVAAFATLQDKIPDLILMDMNMPRMNGRTAVFNLRNNPHTEHIPIICISSLNDHALIKSLASLNIQGYLRKPMEFEELLYRIHRVWDT